jgi:hypothetical protein
MVVSPQTGMAPYWYKSQSYPDYLFGYRAGYYSRHLYPQIAPWPPLLARRDRHDPLVYKGRLHA